MLLLHFTCKKSDMENIMKKILFGILLSCIVSYNVFADTSVNVEISGQNVQSSVEKDEVTLYNFSDSLLTAVQDCSPYQEDFTDTNPNLKSIGQIFGGADFEVLINIKGFDNEMCNFVITQKFSGIGGTENVCSVDKEILSQIVSAMKNRSTELITETFTTQSTITDDGGNVLDTSEVNNTVTGSAFDIMLTKVMGNHCQIKELEPTQEEQEETQEQMLGFSEEFIDSLKTCTPNKEEKSMLFMTTEAEIVGKKEDLCHIQTSDFNFYIPKDKVAELTGFDKLYELVSDEKIAQYRIIKHYSLSSILPMIQKCSQKRYSSKGISTLEKMDKIKIEKSVTTQYDNGNCTLNIVNKLTVDNTLKDYSITCLISDENLNAITTNFAISGDDEENEQIGKQILDVLATNKLCAPTDK